MSPILEVGIVARILCNKESAIARLTAIILLSDCVRYDFNFLNSKNYKNHIAGKHEPLPLRP
ncbi:MAG: hypothetical protein DYH15_00060 [Nitrosomonas sp. PRO4]|nr:hypothetical protein [Nitrosomonas sp. PRO4]